MHPIHLILMTINMNKRAFLKKLAMLGFGTTLPMESAEAFVYKINELSPQEIAQDEDFWATIRGGYKLKPDYINLENGYYCFLPEVTLEHFIKHVREVNYQGSYYMRTRREKDKLLMVSKLAELAGVSPDEIGITRNTTESLDTVISGFEWQAGDEAVMAEQDYFSMLTMFKQVAKRYGVANKLISIPLHPKSDEEIVNLYASVITPKTRLLLVPHIVNITGQIMPIRKICEMAHSQGVQVLVDGAHAFAHIQYKISDLNCDYYGASLHKWLSVPLGAGLLYVKKENIPKIWPLLAPGEKADTDITRLNHTGTNPVHVDMAIANAIDYYLLIGAERKEARLRYLQNYWTSKVRQLPHIQLNTPIEPHRACGIANVGIKGMKPKELADILLSKYKIYTVAIDGAGVQGCRITPNVYTTPKELEVLVRALQELGA
jgi:selenocysteine lyase/cysteine desulfurase